MSNNRNDNPLQSVGDLRAEIPYCKFDLKKHFRHLCNLKPDVKNERLLVEPVDAKRFNERGLVYVFCVNGKILKIGHTITDINKRIQSYNCGKKAFRDSGTCSTTNYFILQSLLNINRTVKVYAYFPDLVKYNIFGKSGAERFPSPKAVEKEVIRRFELQHDQIPIGCTQR